MANNPNISAFDLSNPLSSDQLSELEDSLIQIGIARDGLIKAKDAGIDVSDQMAKLDSAEKQARALLNVYGQK